MNSQSVYFFPHTNSPSLSQVGGKGLSLIQGTQKELPVPPGFILSVAFFNAWFQELKKMKVWENFIHPEKYNLKQSCDSLKKHALKLSFTKYQEQELYKALDLYPKETLFAVRSSSPEEDLEGSSFAGGYETVPGVSHHNIKEAIRKTFASCLDYRVTVYKHENGFDTTQPKIAVIIQEQIASEIAGVGFSLNPVTNNYDEAVFTANWGLGETVVSGNATPDTYIVDKVLMHVKDKKLGEKQTSIWLLPKGGTKEEKDKRHNEFTLPDDHIIELTKLVKKVESFYEKPMDIEWAFMKEKLFLLQARPITSFIPLAEELQTNPGERKRLYLDMTISLQGINHPLSVMATSFFKDLLRIVGNTFFNRDLSQDSNKAPALVSNGRIYLHLSFFLLILNNKKRLVSFIHQFDPLAALALSEIDTNEYRSHSNKLIVLPWKLSLKLPRVAYRIYKARHNPSRMNLQTQKELKQFINEAKTIAEKDIPLTQLADELLYALINHAIIRTVPLFITSLFVKSELMKLAGKENATLLEEFDKALPNNITTEMGLALFHVSQLVPQNITKEQLLKGIEQKNLPESFLAAWQDFLETYGFRGPEEIDIAAPRYRENPVMLLDTLLTLKQSKENTREKFEENRKRREEAFENVYQKMRTQNLSHAEHFKSLYKIYETFAGYREAHKYYAVFVLDLLRQKILQKANLLYDEKRLDTIEQIFDLTLKQLDDSQKDISINLKEIAIKNKLFIDKLAKIPDLPTMIDSRGKIIKPHPKRAKEGEIQGMPVSSGIARGKIKVLHSPTEKPFLKGEILVAKATDPGWTPLFINASAVILEVGGVLQHGALVAREYGLPCVTGVENATTLFKDGTVVEVDGSEGIIRLIK